MPRLATALLCLCLFAPALASPLDQQQQSARQDQQQLRQHKQQLEQQLQQQAKALEQQQQQLKLLQQQLEQLEAEDGGSNGHHTTTGQHLPDRH